MFKILNSEGIDWFLNRDNQLLGYRVVGSMIDSVGAPYYSFQINSPPDHDSSDYPLFVAVCEFAVAKGVLRRVHCYTRA